MSNGVQFVNSATNLKFALQSVANATSHRNDLHMRLEVPQKYGWGSVAIGTQMKGALMFVAYPTKDGTGATLSVRTASGEVMPVQIQGVDCKTQTMRTVNSMIDAVFTCYNVADDPRLTKNPSSSNWMWAVGPGGNHALGPNRDSPANALGEHEQYGHFDLDMTKAVVAPVPSPSKPSSIHHTGTQPLHHQTFSSSAPIPAITGTTSNGSTSTGSTHEPKNMHALILAHALLLSTAFLALFPLGVLLLRLHTVRLHHLMQSFASLCCIIGLALAAAFSAESAEHRGFSAGHQILGLITVLLLIPQVVLGTAHHLGFKRRGVGGWMGVVHVNLGRVVMVFGVVAGVSGFALPGNTTGAVLFALAGVGVCVGLGWFLAWDRRRKAGFAGGEGNKEGRESMVGTQRFDHQMQVRSSAAYPACPARPARPERPRTGSVPVLQRPDPIRIIYPNKHGFYNHF